MTDHSWAGYGRQPGGRIDVHSAASVAISEEHWVVHQGLAFRGGHKFTAVANGATVDMLFKVPAGAYPHLHKLDVVGARGDIDLALYRDSTVSADGTSVALRNLNLNSANTAETTLFHTPTVTDAGTLVGINWLPPTATGTGQSANGLVFSQVGMEWILAPNANYLLRATNNSGASINLLIAAMLYELNGD